MHLISVRLFSLTIFFFFFFYAVLCFSSFYLSLYVAWTNRRGASENHVKKGNRRGQSLVTKLVVALGYKLT